MLLFQTSKEPIELSQTRLLRRLSSTSTKFILVDEFKICVVYECHNIVHKDIYLFDMIKSLHV